MNRERQPQLALERRKQVQDLRLHGDVERRHGLVGDEQPWLEDERASDADALLLAARELARVPGVAHRTMIGPPPLQHRPHSAPAFGPGADRDARRAERQRSRRSSGADSGSRRNSPGRPSEPRAGSAAVPHGRTRRGARFPPSKEIFPFRRLGEPGMTQRARVDLPQPDSPTTPSVVPFFIVNETPSSACTSAPGLATSRRGSASRRPDLEQGLMAPRSRGGCAGPAREIRLALVGRKASRWPGSKLGASPQAARRGTRTRARTGDGTATARRPHPEGGGTPIFVSDELHVDQRHRAEQPPRVGVQGRSKIRPGVLGARPAYMTRTRPRSRRRRPGRG